MKKNLILAPLIVLIAILFSGCAIVGGIFKAGMWTGIIAVVVVVGLLIFLVSKIFGGGRS